MCDAILDKHPVYDLLFEEEVFSTEWTLTLTEYSFYLTESRYCISTKFRLRQCCWAFSTALFRFRSQRLGIQH